MVGFRPSCRKTQEAVPKGGNLSNILDFRGVTAYYIQRFSTTRLEHVKDFFLFCCLTGMSYIDVSTLLPVHLCRDNKGQLWIHKSRVKITAAKETCTSNVPLLAPAVAILDKYRGWNPDNPDGPCLPVPSNQR